MKRAFEGPQGPETADRDPVGGGVIVFPQGPSDRGHVVVRDARPVSEKSWVEYYKVKRPKVPVLVNLYDREGGKLLNVDVNDEFAKEEDVSAGTAVRVELRSVRIGDTVCDCIVVEREFVRELYCVITMEAAPRLFVGLLRKSTRVQDLLVLESTADNGTLALELTRRENWTRRALYHVPGRGVWVRGPSGLMRRYVEETYGAASTEEIEFSKVENAEEAEAKRRIPVGDGYFVECDHGLVRPWGWLVTLRRVNEESTALVAKRTTTGVGILPDAEALKAVEALKAMDAERSNEERSNEERSNEERSNEERSNEERSDAERSNEERSNEERSNEERSAADAIRGAGGKRVFGTATVVWKLNNETKKTKELELAVRIDGHTHVYGVRDYIGAGSYNFVFAPRVDGAEVEGVVMRLTKPGKPRPSREAFEREAAFMRELDKIGVGPKVYATLEVKLNGTLLLGFAMERFETTLSEIPECPRLMRNVFVEADGETALVDLYVRSSELIRCADTKPGNVVVQLGPGGTFRLAMIDVAPDFCAEHELTDARPGNGNSFGVADLDAGLASGSPRYIAAGISLLVHCTEASYAMNIKYGFGYARVAACLLRHLPMLWSTLGTAAWASANRTLAAYFGYAEGGLTVNKLAYRLRGAVDKGHLIDLCRTLGEGELYETAALKFSSIGYILPARIQSRDALVEELGGRDWKVVACSREGCPFHQGTAFGRWV